MAGLVFLACLALLGYVAYAFIPSFQAWVDTRIAHIMGDEP